MDRPQLLAQSGEVIRQGDRILVEKGAVVRSMHPQHREPRVLKRQQVVEVRIEMPYGDDPYIAWAGTGGYWQDCPIKHVIKKVA